MSVNAYWITGINVGFEFYDDYAEHGLILDLVILRIIFLKDK